MRTEVLVNHPALLGILAPLLALLIVWSIIWKGLALWRAARLGSKPWFIVLLIVNTAGILEILYLIFFSKPAASQGDGSAAPD